MNSRGWKKRTFEKLRTPESLFVAPRASKMDVNFESDKFPHRFSRSDKTWLGPFFAIFFRGPEIYKSRSVKRCQKCPLSKIQGDRMIDPYPRATIHFLRNICGNFASREIQTFRDQREFLQSSLNLVHSVRSHSKTIGISVFFLFSQ